jgi:hypothetical protein
MTEKKPTFILPVLGQPPEMEDDDDHDEESDWEAGDEAVPHPDASAAPDIEKAFLAAMSGEARPARTCCEEMEVQLGFARSAPVILYDGKSYWLPVAGADRMGAKVLYCPWCGKRLEEKKAQSAKKKFNRPNKPGPNKQGSGLRGQGSGGKWRRR